MVAIVLALQRLRACRIERPASSWPRRLAPAAAELRLGTHDYDRDAGKPVCAWDDAQARDVLVDGLVGDPKTVLAAVEAAMEHEHQGHPQAARTLRLPLLSRKRVAQQRPRASAGRRPSGRWR